MVGGGLEGGVSVREGGGTTFGGRGGMVSGIGILSVLQTVERSKRA